MEISKVADLIHVVRGQRVMLDEDLAGMYGVPTKRLNEQVQRNLRRFPPDFMFRLTAEEYDNLKSQIATSRSRWGGRRKWPRAFTQEGVAMLSSVLNSPSAIDVNLAIMRAFVRLRGALAKDRALTTRMRDAEEAISAHDRELTEHAAHLNQAFAEIRRLKKS
ncbi:MAG TPA: ORF6N domain-containing protein [Elusimicrobiota bacterium]|nr:ORF6N domain-containing protein [Elusimicrobiota bacterium]